MDNIKLKNVCASKNSINRVKRHTTEWEKISACHVSHKELISKGYKEFL